MNTIKYKNRERIDRGKLKSFDDLPESIKENFKTIKEVINQTNPNTKCFVMGSYYWGFWDEMSDLDIVVDTSIKNIQEIKDSLPNIKFDILNVRMFREVEIP